MRVLYLFSLSLLGAMAFAMSCSSDNAAEPKCDGSLGIMVQSKTDQTTCSIADGSITVSASGGTEPYQYSINGGTKQSSAVFNSLSKGTYSITVFDKNKCEMSVSGVLVNLPASTLDFTFSTVSDTDCSASNGEISINATGSSDYTYSKDNGLNFLSNSSFGNLDPATYSVVVKDGNGCKVTKSVIVAQGSTGVTYTNDILPIFQSKCSFSGCHPEQGDWFTYNTAKDNASLIKTKTGNKSMPKSPQPGGSLSEQQIALIACWANDGAPQ